MPPFGELQDASRTWEGLLGCMGTVKRGLGTGTELLRSTGSPRGHREPLALAGDRKECRRLPADMRGRSSFRRGKG